MYWHHENRRSGSTCKTRETHEDAPTPQAMKVVLVLCKAVTEVEVGSLRLTRIVAKESSKAQEL